MVKTNTRCTLLAIQIRIKFRVHGVFCFNLSPHCSLPMYSDNFHFNFTQVLFVSHSLTDTKLSYLLLRAVMDGGII